MLTIAVACLPKKWEMRLSWRLIECKGCAKDVTRPLQTSKKFKDYLLTCGTLRTSCTCECPNKQYKQICCCLPKQNLKAKPKRQIVTITFYWSSTSPPQPRGVALCCMYGWMIRSLVLWGLYIWVNSHHREVLRVYWRNLVTRIPNKTDSLLSRSDPRAYLISHDIAS